MQINTNLVAMANQIMQGSAQRIQGLCIDDEKDALTTFLILIDELKKLIVIEDQNIKNRISQLNNPKVEPKIESEIPAENVEQVPAENLIEEDKKD